MDKIVYEVDIKDTSDIRIEYCEPVGAFTLDQGAFGRGPDPLAYCQHCEIVEVDLAFPSGARRPDTAWIGTAVGCLHGPKASGCCRVASWAW